MTMTMTTTLRSAAVYRDLARARQVYADDGTVEVADRGSVGRALVGCSWTCCPPRNSPASPDYPRSEK